MIRSLAVLALCPLILLACGEPAQRTITHGKVPYDLETLRRMTEGRDEIHEALGHRFVLLIYLDNLSCMACVNRDLEHLQALYRLAGHPDLAMLLVVFDPLQARTLGESPFLHGLLRSGRVPYPVVTEVARGESRLGSEFNMALVDQEQAAMVLRYTPKVTRDDWPQFEKQLTRRIHH